MLKYEYIKTWDILKKSNNHKEIEENNIIYPEYTYKSLERHIILWIWSTKLKQSRMMEQWWIPNNMKNKYTYTYTEASLLLICLNVLSSYIDDNKDELISDGKKLNELIRITIDIENNVVNIKTTLLDLKATMKNEINKENVKYVVI